MSGTDTWCGAAVVLRDGKRVGWKILRGSTPSSMGLADRYFGGRGMREMCTIETARFDDPECFDKARDWCRGFERHPAAPRGFEP